MAVMDIFSFLATRLFFVVSLFFVSFALFFVFLDWEVVAR